jgi:hypothetical protein
VAPNPVLYETKPTIPYIRLLRCNRLSSASRDLAVQDAIWVQGFLCETPRVILRGLACSFRIAGLRRTFDGALYLSLGARQPPSCFLKFSRASNFAKGAVTNYVG